MRCVFYAVALLLTGFAYAGEGILWQASYGTCVGRLFMTPEAALKACYPDIQRQGWKMIKDPSKPYYYVIGPSLDKEYQNITGYRKVCYKADIKNHGKSDGVSMPKTLPLVHYRRAPKGKDAGQWYPDSFKQCEDGCEMQYNAYTISYTADSDISVVTEKDGTSRKAFTVKRTGGLCETPPPEDPNNPQPPKPDTADDGKPDDGKPGDGKDGGSDDDGSGSGDEGGSGSGSEEGEGETGKDDGEGEGDGSGKDGDSGCTGGDTGGGGCDSGSGSGDSGSADEPVDIWLRCPSGRGSYKKGTKPEGECAAKPADPKKPDDGKGDDQDKGDDDKPDPDGKQNPPNNGSDGDPSGNNPGGHGHRGGGGSSGGGGGSHGGGSSGGSGGDGDGGGDGKGNGKSSISGGNCKTGKPPVCKGDPVQCYIAKEQWRTACLAERGGGSVSGGSCKDNKPPECKGDPTQCYIVKQQFYQGCEAARQQQARQAEQDYVNDNAKAIGEVAGSGMDDVAKGLEGNGKSIDLGSVLDLNGYGWSRTCPVIAPIDMGKWGKLEMDTSAMCVIAQIVGNIMVAMSLMFSVRYVFAGG